MVNKQTYRAATLRIDLKYLPGQCSDEKFSVVNFVHFSSKKIANRMDYKRIRCRRLANRLNLAQ